MRVRQLVPILWIGAAPLACAQSLETVTVTAALSGTDPAALGGEVLDAAELQHGLPFSALEALDGRAGLVAIEKGGAGGSSYLAVRGGEPNYTPVLLDGVRLNDPTNSQGGSFDLDLIDPAALGSIGVFRSALSAVHGSDALSGVVNLQWRSLAVGESLRAAHAQGDTGGGYGVGATLGQGSQQGMWLVGAGLSDSGDVSGSARHRWQAYAHGLQELAGLQLSGTLLHADSNRRDFPEDSGGERLAVDREREHATGQLDLLGLVLQRAATEGIRPRAYLNWSRQYDDTDTPAIYPGVLEYVPPIFAQTAFTRGEARGDVQLPVRADLALLVGGGLLQEQGRSRGAVDYGLPIPADFDIRRHTTSGYAELTATPRTGTLAIAGLRYDDPSSQHGVWTGRLSLRRQLPGALPALYANWSDGYKLPSLYALAYPLIANPQLRPERSRGVELGIEPQLSSGRLRLAYFHTRFSDMIDFDPVLFTDVNRDRVVTQGIEGSWQQQLARMWSLRADLTWMNTDADPGVMLRQRPRWRGMARLGRPFRADTEAWLRIAYSGSREDSSVPTGSIQLPAYLRTDLGIDREIAHGWRLSAALLNLFNRRYEPTVGTPAPGMELRVGISAQLDTP